MARREFLMLGKVYDPAKHNVAGYYMSEKLDGIRCFWDGGITRGVATRKVPWAGVINPKTEQPKTKVRKTATGLWSRYGNPIVAPDWFLNSLPCVPLDGELYAGRKKFQQTTSVVKKEIPIDEEWQSIQFAVFSCPDFNVVMQDGLIKNSQQITDMSLEDVRKFVGEVDKPEDWRSLAAPGGVTFSAELLNLKDWIDPSEERVFLVRQAKLPNDEEIAKRIIDDAMGKVLSVGGEGLILRDPDAAWSPKRVKTLLKVKGCLDDEAIVTGFTSGRETTKGSKLLGLIGALILDYKGQRLELSGLTNQEREFLTEGMTEHATANPGVDMPPDFQGKHFKTGDKVTFTYRELSDGGLPKEARYLRKRDDQ